MIKKSVKLLLLTALVLAAAASAGAQSKKKPADIYIRSAKIEVQSGEIERYFTAVAYLDTLAIYYGPVSEGLYWTRKIYTDLVEKTGELQKKGEYVRTMVAYNDSLHQCCESKDINKKYRKNCKQYISEGDSTMSFFWATFYNAGVEQINQIEQVVKDLDAEQNEESKSYYEDRFTALRDSCEFNMSMAIAIDSTDALPYLGMAKVYTFRKKHAEANEWLIRALKYSNDRKILLPQIAYNFTELGEYDEAIPYYEEIAYTDSIPTDDEGLQNLAGSITNLYVCFMRTSNWDGADKVLHHLLEIFPENVDGLYRLGRLQMTLGGAMSDSASSAPDTAAANHYREIQRARFDSAAVYLQQAFDLDTTNIEVAEDLGLVLYVRDKFKEASVAFERAVKLDSAKTENWLSLGDICLRLERWPEAARAYERVIQAQPDNKRILEALDGLYVETKQPGKRAEIQKKLKELK